MCIGVTGKWLQPVGGSSSLEVGLTVRRQARTEQILWVETKGRRKKKKKKKVDRGSEQEYWLGAR